MERHNFFAQFANTPIARRFIPLNFQESGMDTLQSIYSRVHELTDKIRNDEIEIQHLINLAEKFWDREAEELLKPSVKQEG